VVDERADESARDCFAQNVPETASRLFPDPRCQYIFNDIVAEIGIPPFPCSPERLGIAYVIRDYFCSLFLERPTPRARTYADRPCENSREVTLVAEAAGRGHISQRHPPVPQRFLCHLDAALH
jgi:hypothetical protein